MTVTDENRHSRAHVDVILIALVFGMSLFGVVAVCVATFSPGSDPDASFLNHIFGSSYATRQCLFLLIAPLVVGVIMAFPYEILRQRAELFYWISFALLTVTTIFNRAQGVKAWMDIIWGYTIQPSEFAKLAMILILAKNLSKQDKPLSDFRSFSRIFLMVMIPGLVILLQGETGSLLVIIFLFAVMMFFSNVSLKTLGILAAIAILGILAVYGFMVATGSTDYRLARIRNYMLPMTPISRQCRKWQSVQAASAESGCLRTVQFHNSILFLQTGQILSIPQSGKPGDLSDAYLFLSFIFLFFCECSISPGIRVTNSGS